MDVFEKLNKAFAGWYESLFGDAVSDLRPKDVLRKIVGAMEDNRKEGLDSRVYVPNKYVLEIAFDSDEEKEYLLAFLDKDELESALRKYMAQNKYYLRGPLDFTVQEMPVAEGDTRSEKLRVRCRWDIRSAESEMPVPPPAPEKAVPGTPYDSYEDEEFTVAATDVYDAGTVSPPVLVVTHADGSADRFVLNKPVMLIGRSKRLGNDLVLDRDGMVSKRHARISFAADGFSIQDLNSTNGVWVNGKRVSQCQLKNGDHIVLGATEMVFEESGLHRPEAQAAASRGTRPRLILQRPDGRNEECLLASQMIIGRALTSDICLRDASVDRRHARVFTPDEREYEIEDLDSRTGTMVNGEPVISGTPVRLKSGDWVKVGSVEMRFEVD